MNLFASLVDTPEAKIHASKQQSILMMISEVQSAAFQ